MKLLMKYLDALELAVIYSLYIHAAFNYLYTLKFKSVMNSCGRSFEI